MNIRVLSCHTAGLTYQVIRMWEAGLSGVPLGRFLKVTVWVNYGLWGKENSSVALLMRTIRRAAHDWRVGADSVIQSIWSTICRTGRVVLVILRSCVNERTDLQKCSQEIAKASAEPSPLFDKHVTYDYHLRLNLGPVNSWWLQDNTFPDIFGEKKLKLGLNSRICSIQQFRRRVLN